MTTKNNQTAKVHMRIPTYTQTLATEVFFHGIKYEL